MKYLDEFRDGARARRLAESIHQTITKSWTIMEVCGGQTHSIVKYAIDDMLPPALRLIHGPGCPVCVTPLELIDRAIELAQQPRLIFCSFGDMLRVPGSQGNLLQAKAAGADVRMVYSPLDALHLAQSHTDKEVVFFAVGFETTAPTTAVTVLQAKAQGVKNFSMLVSHVLVPPALKALMSSPDNQVQGFLAPGHVCTVMGYEEYYALSSCFHVPIVVSGFEPLDILQGILCCVRQLEAASASVENAYARCVSAPGNQQAQTIIKQVFDVVDRKWRGIGNIPASGYGLREEYVDYNAEKRFSLLTREVEEETECLSGVVLQGKIKPNQCPLFGKRCTPEHPLGATMVSSEGACAAYYLYRRSEAN